MPSPIPSRRWSLEAGLVVLIGLIAAALRLYDLGAHPLSEAEAVEALAAFRFVHGQAGPLPQSPAYTALTILTFFVAGSSDGLARLVPALAGSLLALTPALFRREIGRPTALVAAALLAISPTFVAASRLAGGHSLAVLTLTLAAAAWLRFVRNAERRWLLASAASLGIGLATGPAMATGVAAVLIGWGLIRWSRLSIGLPSPVVTAADARPALIFGLAAWLGLSTLGLLYRAGLAAWGNALLEWLKGFLPATSLMPLSHLPLSLLAYELFLLAFGVVGLILAWRSSAPRFQALGLLAGAAYVLVTLRSARQAADLQWVLLPMVPIAAMALVRSIRIPQPADDRTALTAQAAISLLLFGLAWMTLAASAESVRTSGWAQPAALQLALALGAIGVIGLLALLFASGWSSAVAAVGLATSGAAALLIYTLGAGWGLTQLRPADGRELWHASPTSMAVGDLVSTVEGLSNLEVGSAHDIELTIVSDPDWVLGWAFRDFSRVVFLDNLGGAIGAPLVIAPAGEALPALADGYVGQDFVVREQFPRAGLPAEAWIGWFAFRRVPVERERVVLWARVKPLPVE